MKNVSKKTLFKYKVGKYKYYIKAEMDFLSFTIVSFILFKNF